MVTQKMKIVLSKAHVSSKQNMQIAWQNKDIISKIFAENFGSRSLDAYGISLPRINELKEAIKEKDNELSQTKEKLMQTEGKLSKVETQLLEYERRFGKI